MNTPIKKTFLVNAICLGTALSGAFGIELLYNYLDNKDYKKQEYHEQACQKQESHIDETVNRAVADLPQKQETVQTQQTLPNAISNRGLELIRCFEGFSPRPYSDASGYSIGYGHFIKDGEQLENITREEGEALLRTDVRTAERAIQSAVKVSLNQNQYDALVSFVYNVGQGNFGKSTLLRKLNTGDYDGAGNELLNWCKSQGEILESLRNRRNQERALFTAN